MEAKILVTDDDPFIQEIFRNMLSSLGHKVLTVGGGEDALGCLQEFRPDILLLDLNLPDLDGMEVLQRARTLLPNLSVILISGSLSVSDAVEAMKHGAFHCLTKPVSMKDLDSCIKQAASGLVLHKEIRCEGLPDCRMVVASAAMEEVREIIHKVSRSGASTVLLMGETGTGKEVVARHLHHLSERREAPFVAVNCAAIPATLIESELFGHDRGAFTDAKNIKRGLFEEAQGGTLFLDEIGELAMPMQAKLLRALQEKAIRRVGGGKDIAVDVRIIAASNGDLAKAVRENRFREDLYYRLQVIPLVIPPLRERIEDIIPLAEHFCREFAREFGRSPMVLTEANKEILKKYSWPGNVRELRNCIERALLLELPEILPRPETDPKPAISNPSEAIPLHPGKFVLALADPSLANVEKALIMEVMNRVHGNKNQAATLLGINRTTLYRKLSSYGMEELATAL